MARQQFTAIESAAELRQTVDLWRSKFSARGEEISGLGPGTIWHERLGIWGHFGKWKRDDGSDRYWNTFGFSTVQLRKNMVVEVNPPGKSTAKNSQGVIARSPDGSRWVLHRGGMSIRGARISAEQFDHASQGTKKSVAFSDGTLIDCYPVANLESASLEMQEQIARFVALCHRVRVFYLNGKGVAEEEARVEAAESSPELTGSFVVGPQGRRIVRRRHGDVWHALTSSLDRLEAKHTNSRVGRWGPDLRTIGDKPTLFEIKLTISASDLQRAVGQLLLYERLLKKTHRKVLLLPQTLKGALVDAVQMLGLEVLTFTRSSRAVTIDQKRLKQFVG